MRKANSLSKLRSDQQLKRKSVISNILQHKCKNEFNQNIQSQLNFPSSSLSHQKKTELFKSFNNMKEQIQKQKFVQNNYDNIQFVLFKAKEITQTEQNKLKIDNAKKFKINHKKNAITFLTGLQIIQLKPKDKKTNIVQNQTHLIQTDQDLKKLLNPQYDDLQQLRRMIRQTDKNLASYKKQTLSIKKEVLKAGQKFNKYGYSLADLNYKKINNIQIQRNFQRSPNKTKNSFQIRVSKKGLSSN